MSCFVRFCSYVVDEFVQHTDLLILRKDNICGNVPLITRERLHELGTNGSSNSDIANQYRCEKSIKGLFPKILTVLIESASVCYRLIPFSLAV